MADLTLDPVKLTWQLPDARVQLVALRTPALVGVNVTVPEGVVAPVAEESVTVTVQVDAWLITTGLWQLMLVAVLCKEKGLTVMLVGALPLPECTMVPAKVPVTLAVPETDAAKVTVQLDIPTAVSGASVQEDSLKVPVAVPVEPKLTTPVGSDGLPRETSVTVAVQLEGWFTDTGLAQLTNVVVERYVTMILAGMLVLIL